MLDLSHNDYLGLRLHPGLIATIQDAVATWGVGSGGSPLVCGYDHPKATFEDHFANFIGGDAAPLMNNGYQANLAVVSTLLPKDPVVIMDKAYHASWYDGVRLAQVSLARIKRYRHQDFSHFQQLLQNHQHLGPMVVISEDVFSMTGSYTDLPSLLALTNYYGAKLWLDDGHGLAVLGEHGQGVVGALARQVEVLTYLLGKGFAMQGAVVVSHDTNIQRLVEQARSYIYSTAATGAQAATLLEALQLIKSFNSERQQLHALIDYWCSLFVDDMPLTLLPSTTPPFNLYAVATDRQHTH